MIERIRIACNNIPRAMLLKTVRNFRKRIQSCIEVTFLNKTYRFGPKAYFHWTNTLSVRGKGTHVNQAPQRETPSVKGKGTHVNQAPRIMKGKGILVNQAPRIMRGKGTHVNQALRIVRGKGTPPIKHPKGNRKLLRPRRCSWIMRKVVLKWNHLFSSKSPLWSTFRP